MKHLFISLLVASVSISAVAQDIQFTKAPVLSGTVVKVRPQIEANQRIISDFYEAAGNGAAPFNNGETMIGSYYPQEMLKPFIGCNIKSIRVLAKDVSSIKNVFIREGSTIAEATEIKAEEPLGSSIGDNWYEIKLKKAIEITADTKGFVVGYNLEAGNQRKITIGKNGVNSYRGNLFTYYSKINDWINRSTIDSYTLPLQLVVEPATGVTMNEVVVSHIELPQYTEVGKAIKVDYWLSNASSTPVNNFELDVLVDNKLIKTISVDGGVAVGETNKKFTIDEVQPNISAGKHNLVLKFKKINGNELNDIKGSENNHRVLYYKNVVARQKTLVEEFTSERCINCYRGIQNIKELKKRQLDMVMVAVHLNEKQFRDDVAAPESQFIKQMANVSGIPSFACNRIAFIYNKQETIANPNIAQISEEATQAIDNFYDFSKKNTCVFSTLGIVNKYDKDSKKIKITVTGTGVEKANELLEDYALFVLVKENNVDGRQGNENGMLDNVKHQDVLRGYVSDVKGDNDLVWNGDNFTKTYDFAIQNNWKPADLEVVAFIAPKVKEIGFNLENLAVQNCISEPLANDANAIDNIPTDSNAKEIGRYNVKGQRISAPQKGINIVKFSNGKVLKEIVK
ncbi:Omp28-related outer membrane protein [Prevotella aurantiaca]|uniref:Omp28-related outer membrane protein n=1 Tax=Prevotella aurantiaca TaxID=596085 RepID=UPI002355441B|nr:Omp28-related outer membrane protein [Prevotella aurantiaca]